jgi:hypothetical protein
MEPQTKVRFYVVAIHAEVNGRDFTYNVMQNVSIEPDETEEDVLNHGRETFIKGLAGNYGIAAEDVDIVYIDCLEITAEDLDPNSYG